MDSPRRRRRPNQRHHHQGQAAAGDDGGLFRGYVCIDTACLIGYPLGFREITVTDDGWLTSRWLTLDLPEILEASSQLATDEHNHRWAGEFGDRDITILLPRARAIWHS